MNDRMRKGCCRLLTLLLTLDGSDRLYCGLYLNDLQ